MSQGFGIESVDVKKSTPTVSQPTQVADIGCIQQRLVEYFADIEDPRVERTKKHQLTGHISHRDSSNHRGSARMGRHRKLWHQ